MNETNKKKAMNSRFQTGATMWTTISVGLMVAFIGMLAFKLAPIYLDHSIVRSSMQEIVNQSGFKEMTQKQILSRMQKRMQIDNIRGFDSEAFKVGREKSGKRYIIINYSRKVSIASNVSALVEFQEEIRTSR